MYLLLSGLTKRVAGRLGAYLRGVEGGSKRPIFGGELGENGK